MCGNSGIQNYFITVTNNWLIVTNILKRNLCINKPLGCLDFFFAYKKKVMKSLDFQKLLRQRKRKRCRDRACRAWDKKIFNFRSSSVKTVLSFVGFIPLNSLLQQLKINQNQIIQYFLWTFYNCQDWPVDKISPGIPQRILSNSFFLLLLYK